jgi:hypothetical protein
MQDDDGESGRLDWPHAGKTLVEALRDGLAHVRDCGASRVCATPIGDDEIF